jgi:hypothetical protein
MNATGNDEGSEFGDLQLELSLKPFFDATVETRRRVCHELFGQWRELARHSQRISVLLWVGDGSEILEYSGEVEDSFEWARYNGAANHHRWEWPNSDALGTDPDHNGIGIAVGARDPERKGIHCHAYFYRPNPAVFTYRWLKGLVEDLKEIGAAATGKPILVGEAFDIGPEFARSRFKYEWHREILSDGPVFKEQFISCEAVLKSDQRPYAAFPQGIPEGTSIGTFLGAQTRRMFDDCGFDFLWLSNGFGFALEPWAMVGRIFDGSRFHANQAESTASRILAFWRDLRSGLGKETPIRCRGTNLATGIDLGSDASPVRHIYSEIPGVEIPVNSPWAALDGDFGLELAGWMSHIVVRSDAPFRFRFYIHDPWWLNSPWFDRYGRRPHDLCLPLSVSRLELDGSVSIPRDLAFLTVNDSHGRMPGAAPNEVTAALLRTREWAPDAMGPLVWIYPLVAFDRMVMEQSCPERPFHADAWMGTAIGAGIPINSVADADVLKGALREKPSLVEGRIFFAPVPPPGSEYEELIRLLIGLGADLLLVGPLFPGSFLWEELGLRPCGPLEGDFHVPDYISGQPVRRIRHTGFLSAGGWQEVINRKCEDEAVMILEGEREAARRAALVVRRSSSGGRTGWIRASLATAEYDPNCPAPIRGPILRPLESQQFISNGALARVALAAYGWWIDSEIAPGMTTGPYLTVHRHRNGLVLSGYHRNENSSQLLRLPLGAPLLIGCHNRLQDGATLISGEVAWQYEVRVLVDGMTLGEVVCRDLPPLMQGVRRRILVGGLEAADVRILCDPEHLASLRLLREPKFPYFLGETVDSLPETRDGHLVVTAPGVTGELLIEW